MNHCYRLVWNELQRAYVVAPENARGKSKSNGRKTRSLAVLLGTTLLASFAANALAAPTDGVVTSGNGHIATNGAVTTITQNSDKLSLNWGSFNIAGNETVNFIQPGSNSIALNRIIGSGATEIYGKLNANGQVFLLNPNGVLFGAGASVNVGGLVATTLNLSDADFNAGKYQFTASPNSTGKIINQGSITAADGGYIALLGGQVSNQGTLAAKLGNVTLAAGSDMTLDFVGDGLLSVTVNQGTLNALAENKQLIQADGGHVLLTAKAADSLIQAVVNNEGVIEARTVDNRNGTIMLMGDMQNGLTKVGGTLDASAQNGNGGFIETSAAKVQISDNAHVTTKAANGQTGTWLIDPNDFTIAASGGDMTGAAVSNAVQNNNFEIQSTSGATSGNGDIHVNDAISWSSNNTLTLTAERNININQSITATGNAAGLVLNYGNYTTAGTATANTDYHVKAPITLSGANATLAINADNYMLIHSMADLIGINAGLNGKYALAQNLDAGGTTYTDALIGSLNNNFNGSFAGLGHTISNLTINSTANNIGLFRFADSNSVIRDIGLLGGSMIGNIQVGALVGRNHGSINNAYATSNVSGDTSVGGLVGWNQGDISNVYSTGSVTGLQQVGGLAGYNESNISDAYAIGNVTGDKSVGGLVGWNQSSINNAYASGNVSGYQVIGGLVGGNDGSIRQSYATGTVTSTDYSAGGLVGQNRGDISYTYATGSVNGSDRVGGLVGHNIGNLDYSYATGRVNGNMRVGGLIGRNDNIDGEGNASNSYWDQNSTGQINAIGQDTGSSSINIAAVNSTSAYSYANYTNLGTWSETASGSGVWVARDGSGNPQWIMIEGSTRPFLYSEYSTTIRNTHQLQLMALNLSASYTLSGNINATETNGSSPSGMWTTAGFSPIGNNTNRFTGTFDGQNHAISNLFINRPTTDYVGLFRYTASSGLIRNIGLLGGSVSGKDFVGGLVGWSGGGISNAYATGSVNGSDSVGGLVGVNGTGSISNAYATGSVNGNNYVGGLVGYSLNNGSISNAYAIGSVNGNNYVGGLVGINLGNGSINNAYAAGSVSGDNVVGGLVGKNSGNISNAYATGSVSGSNLIGGYPDGDQIGGLVGLNEGNISSVYATGTVIGNNFIGGLVGLNGGSINNAYTTGNARGSNNAGWLVGFSHGGVSDSFYATTDANGNPINPPTNGSVAGTAKTFAELTQLSTFASWGSDIDAQGGTGSVWRIYEGNSTPLLRSSLKAVTVTMDGIHNGAATGSNVPYTLSDTTATLSGQLNYNVIGNALVFSGLYSGQQGYDISYAPVSSTYHPAPTTTSGNTSSLPTYQSALNSALDNDEAVQIAEQKDILTIVDGGMRLPAGLGH
ncbi:GLUG motif-containing protein [Herminiimonas arsenitoxidans]|uniref:GLUG motif-containing protein n=1 Tax=Herminiimonas arsenitoxidans TaxID=1809410 RepID=UPI000970A66C|nr:GLUG motif-containing protein [Herminiimonas arsenitoxidans]